MEGPRNAANVNPSPTAGVAERAPLQVDDVLGYRIVVRIEVALALLLALAIFGGAAYFSYNVLFKQEIAVQKEQRGEIPSTPAPDLSLPEFQEAAKLRTGRQTGRGAKRPDHVHSKISQRSAFRGGEGPAGCDQHRYSLFARALAGKTGIHRQERRRHRPGRAENENNAGTHHADQQHEQHHAPDRRTTAHLQPRFLDLHSDQTECDCADQPRSVFKQYHVQEVKLPAKPAATDQHQSGRSFSVEKWQTGRVRQP